MNVHAGRGLIWEGRSLAQVFICIFVFLGTEEPGCALGCQHPSTPLLLQARGSCWSPEHPQPFPGSSGRSCEPRLWRAGLGLQGGAGGLEPC